MIYLGLNISYKIAMIEFILGSKGAGKTELAYSHIENRLKKKELSWVLVPEQFSLYMEREIINHFGVSAQRYVKVLSFSRLCNLVLQKMGPLRMKYIDGAGKQIVAAKVIQNLKGKLGTMEKNLNQKGFSQVFLKTVSECKRYGVSPQALRFAAENTKDERLAGKLTDLATMYETYNQILEVSNSDAEDNLSLICPKIQKCDFINGKIFVWYFRSFTPVEQRALGELMHKADICFIMEYSDHKRFGGLFSLVGSTIKKLKEEGERREILVKEPVFPDKSRNNHPIKYLYENYFDPRCKVYNEKINDIVFYESNNIYSEIEAAADLTLKLCREENLRFSDILILARETASYNRLISPIFQSRGIKVFLDTRRPISQKPLVRMLGGIMEILAYGYSYERVMAIAKSGLSSAKQEDIDELENYILATAPSHSMWQKDNWEYAPKGRWDLDAVNRGRNAIVKDVKFFEEKISGRKTADEICGAFLNWLKESDIYTRVENTAKEFSLLDKIDLAQEYQQVWNCVIELLGQFATIMKDVPLTYTQFFEIFMESCIGVEIGMTPQIVDCVVFSQIDRFRTSGAKVVIVLGMNSGSFPKGFMTEGLISDSERQELTKMGVELAPGKDAKRHMEQMLIYAVLSAPKDKLFMFRPCADRTGKSYQKSEIIDRILDIMPNIQTIYTDDPKTEINRVEGVDAAFDLLSSSLAEYGANPKLLPTALKELYNWFEQSPENKASLENIKELLLSGTPEKISPEMAEALYGMPLKLSASHLETYNSCAFKYFLTYGLALNERKLAGVEAKDTGSVQHAALYDYFTYLKDNSIDFESISKEDCFNAVGEAVEKEAIKNDEILYETSAYYKYIVMRMKNIASQTAWEVVKFYRSGEFKPLGYEIVINTNGEIPAISVKSQKGKEIAKIKGFIDRADHFVTDHKEYISIVDYKSSEKDMEIQLIKDGIVLQPLLYADAICKSRKDAEPGAMVYLQMNAPILNEKDLKKSSADKVLNSKMAPKGWLSDKAEVASAYSKFADANTGEFTPKGAASHISHNDMIELINQANKKIQESAENISSGIIAPNPYQKGNHDACIYCPYKGICKI